MMANEWNEDSYERKFRQDNIDAAERGVKVERIFIIDPKDKEYIKNNISIKMHLENEKIKSLAVDLEKLRKYNSILLNKIAEGFFAIDEEVILVDLPSDGTSRGYITMNKKQIEEIQKNYNELKSMAIPLKEMLK